MAAFALLVAVATLNRETALLLVLAQGCFAWRCDRRDLRWTLLLLVIWAGVFALTRLVVGEGIRYWTVDRILIENLLTIPEWFLRLLMLLGGLWLYVWRGRHHPFIHTLAPVFIVYAALFVVFGHLYEVRLLVTVLPLLLLSSLLTLR